MARRFEGQVRVWRVWMCVCVCWGGGVVCVWGGRWVWEGGCVNVCVCGCDKVKPNVFPEGEGAGIALCRDWGVDACAFVDCTDANHARVV